VSKRKRRESEREREKKKRKKEIVKINVLDTFVHLTHLLTYVMMMFKNII